MNKLLLSCALISIANLVATAEIVLVEAESFAGKGGWKVDQQFMDQMGSPFLLAHGYGKPVKDAKTTVKFSATGTYHVWVRTRDWVGPWKKKSIPSDMQASGFPGAFTLQVNGKILKKEFGKGSADWQWEYGGTVAIGKSSVELSIHDLKGFDGRCDAIVFSTDKNLRIPNQDPEMARFRRKLLGYPEKAPDAGQYDLVVVGGGIAGTCAAISGARHGLKVALIQDRPVLGGNNSSEVRVHLGGGIRLKPYPGLGSIVAQIDPNQKGNAQPADVYKDGKKLARVKEQKNVDLFLSTHVNEVEKEGNRIKAVIGQHIETGQRIRFPAKVFADCTGDGTVGFLAGADFRVGRESKSETGESQAVAKADKMTMGTSIMWYAVDGKEDFPVTPWAAKFDQESCQKTLRGNWNWETGMHRDQIDDFEYIRDYGMRVVFGNWSFLKNDPKLKQRFADKKLGWVAYIGGKRESRRLIGDLILKQQDIQKPVIYPDSCVTSTWSIDLHYPITTKGFNGESFRSRADQTRIKPYPIPYRCFYSRNVDNLMMAGRNISVTHVALGTVRVMRTTGMMGEVVGMASALCKKHDTTPRGVYKQHLTELKTMMEAENKITDDDYEKDVVLAADGKLGRANEYKIDILPSELTGLPCVTIARGKTTLPASGFKFKVDRKAVVYIAVHNRGEYQLPKEWQKTDLKLQWLERKHSDTVYKRTFPAGIVRIPGHMGQEEARGYYGIPNQAYVKGLKGKAVLSKIEE